MPALPPLYLKRAPKTAEQIEAHKKKLDEIRAYNAEEKKKPEYIAEQKAWEKKISKMKGFW